MANNELYHYGILGMKWGVRRTDAQIAKARKSPPHEDYTKAHSKKSVKQMSNQELNERNKRLNAEKQYKDLKRQNSIRAKGENAARKYVSTAGLITATVAATATYMKYSGKILDKVGSLTVGKIWL